MKSRFKRHAGILPRAASEFQFAYYELRNSDEGFPGETLGDYSGRDWVVTFRAPANVASDNYGGYGEVDLSRSQLGSARPGGVKSGGRTCRPALKPKQ